MRPLSPVLAVPLLVGHLLLAACGGETEVKSDTAAAGFEPPATQRPDPLPGQAQTTPLSAYVGRYPDDPVDGVGFFDRTEVATALDDAVTDAALRRRIVRNEGPRTPIFAVGTRIAAVGCRTRGCGDRTWTLLVDPATGKGELCLRDRAGASRWYAGGPPETRPGGCPSAGRG